MNERRVLHQVRNVERVMNEYRHNEPFSRFLSRFYKANRQMGSSDRRMTSRFSYNLFRLGGALSELSWTERLVVAEFLCEQDSLLVNYYAPDLSDKMNLTLDQKIGLISERYGNFLHDVFPAVDSLSAALLHEYTAFVQSLFVQPDLFVRVKRDSRDTFLKELQKAQVTFEQISDRSFALPNGFDLRSLKGLHRDFEVQDLSSQRTEQSIHLSAGQKWWDCCAASGGKSLMLLDQCPGIQLLVSDVRLSILRNLDERFEQATIRTAYRKKILDLSSSVDPIMNGESFDGILLDAPCTGSGTWGRTPEMLSQFDKKQIPVFSQLQKKISKNVVPYLKAGGTLVYITCSVYQEENEEAALYIEKTLGLRKKEQQNIIGYSEKADSMFIAVFVKD